MIHVFQKYTRTLHYSFVTFGTMKVVPVFQSVLDLRSFTVHDNKLF